MNAADLHDMTMDEIVRRWPAALGVLIDYRMHCIGCPISIFHTPSEAAAEHDLPVDLLIVELLAAIAGTRTRVGRGDGPRRSETSDVRRAQAASVVRRTQAQRAPRD